MNENDEAQYVAARILEDYSQGRRWKDHAVLYRMNAQSNQMEQAFKRNGIPYRIIGGTRFFDRAEVKDMMAYLAVLNNPEDDLRLHSHHQQPSPRHRGQDGGDRPGDRPAGGDLPLCRHRQRPPVPGAGALGGLSWPQFSRNLMGELAALAGEHAPGPSSTRS